MDNHTQTNESDLAATSAITTIILLPTENEATSNSDPTNDLLSGVLNVAEAGIMESFIQTSIANTAAQADTEDSGVMPSTPSGADVALMDPTIEVASAPEVNPDILLAPNSENEEATSTTTEETPAWVMYEDDLSTPDEEEMQEIENAEHDKLNASDTRAMEEQFYTDVGDTEQRPVKKLRLSWLLKGVRGTKEKPNFSRVIHSPGASVDGLYWSIKFYPRGDNCSSLSAFVRCSREPPPVDQDAQEGEFSLYECGPETNFSEVVEPTSRTVVSSKTSPALRSKPSKAGLTGNKAPKKPSNTDSIQEMTNQAVVNAGESRESSTTVSKKNECPNWRLSAQLGMVIYNPAEPRTSHIQSDGHQFSKHCDDWGWVNFVGPWDEIHRRKRGQRRALLQNDILGIDAYIRIYEDPTEALWWHESKDETQWPSKELAGFHPMGTPSLYHSPAVAGITAWFLLSPFRQLIQSVDGGQWRSDSNVEPRPLICHSQLVLAQMRTLSSDCYVNLNKMIEELTTVGETFSDVKSFWEVFRRSLELELGNEPALLQKLSSMFDVAGMRWEIPSLEVQGSRSVKRAFAKHLDSLSYYGSMPNFLPVILNRSTFDAKSCEWKLHHDRVHLDDSLNLLRWCSDDDAFFTLYGFMVHVGPRNSGKFYSVLRPRGIGTKWLAFEDGNGNKIFSYSSTRIREFEGLDEEALHHFTSTQGRENAYMAIYIRTNMFKMFSPGDFEPYGLPQWLKSYAETIQGDEDSQIRRERKRRRVTPSNDVSSSMKVELYLDECMEGSEDTFELHELRTSDLARKMCRTVEVSAKTTFRDLCSAIAQAFEIDDPLKVVMYEIRYEDLGKGSRASLQRIFYRKRIMKEAAPGEIFRIWYSIQQHLGEGTHYERFLDRLNNLNFKQKIIEDDCDYDDMDIERLAEMTEIAEQGINNQTQAVSLPVIDIAAIHDEEQASVEAAVEGDVRSAVVHQLLDTSNAVEAHHLPDQTEDSATVPSDSDINAVVDPHRAAGTDDQGLFVAISSNLEEDELMRPVVHGHLAEVALDSPSAEGVVVTYSSAHVPHTDIDALEQVLAEPDSASILPTEESLADGEGQDHNLTSMRVPRSYGSVYIFDADKQKFLTQRSLHPERDLPIGAAVRKQLGYAETRQIKIWKWQGLNGTELINADLTFTTADMHDAFRLIVGDVLSESKCEELKQAGKFSQPHQLLATIGMRKRKHPSAALTSTDHVELADYGSDYYKGPLSYGRPHGQHGFLITSNGHTYTGPFVAGQKSGSGGKLSYQNGDTYDGEWLNDERHGQGEFVEKRTGNRYVGGFEHGKRWGQGVTYWQVADQQSDMCQICYEEEIDALFFDCGHVCACVICARQCDTCPLCRKSVRQVVKMFRA